MAGRRVLVKNGLVVRIKSGSVSVDRDGAFFQLRIKPKKGPCQRVRSMYLDDLLSRLGNQELAEKISRAFALREVSRGDIDIALPGFFMDRK